MAVEEPGKLGIFFSLFCGHPVLVGQQEKNSSCKSDSQDLTLGTGLTWSNSGKMFWLNKN